MCIRDSSYAGTESEIAKIKQRAIRAAQHFAKYRGTALDVYKRQGQVLSMRVYGLV